MLGAGALAMLPPAAAAQPHTSDPGIYFDAQKLIVQRDGDGGDTAQREGFAWFGVKLRERLGLPAWSVALPLPFRDTLDLLEVRRTGEFRRHPTQGGWKSDPNKFSRDQATPLMAAMGLMGDQERLRRARAAMRTCNFILTCVQGTTDIAGPDYQNLFRRGLGETPDVGGDTFLRLGVVTRLAQATQNPEDVGDDLNLIVQLLMAKAMSPSAESEAARDLYAKNRPVSAGCYMSHYRAAYPRDFDADELTMKTRIARGVARGWTPDCPRVLGALRWYFRAETGGCSSLAELYAPIIERWLS